MTTAVRFYIDAPKMTIPIKMMGPTASMAKDRLHPLKNPRKQPEAVIDKLKIICPNFSPIPRYID